MRTVRTIWSRLRSLGRRRGMKAEIDEELRFHLEQRTAENIAGGMSPEEAARAARKRFGNFQSVREECRETAGASLGENFWQDIRFGARMLRKSPGFTAVAICTLGLGIGANTAVFSVVEGVILRPLPFEQPGRLVSLKCENRRLETTAIGVSVPELLDFRGQQEIFDEVSYVWPMHGNLTGGDRPERVEAVAVSANFFHLLRRNAAHGRTFGAAEEESPTWAEGAVISHGAWLRLFGGDTNVLGRSIFLDYDTYRIIGIMPADFRHPGRTMESSTDVWITNPFKTGWGLNRNVRRLPGLLARLKPGIDVGQAQAALDVLAGRLRNEYPNDYPQNSGWTPRVVPLQQELVGNTRSLLFILSAAVGCVLVICCATIANLLLARAARRRREWATRAAIGASAAALVRQLLTESVLLSFCGGLAGLLAAMCLTPILVRFVPPDVPMPGSISVNLTVLGFAVVVSFVSGILFGLFPALQLRKFDLLSGLKEGAAGTGQARSSHRLRASLVAGQIAVSVMLLAATGLLLKSFWNVLQVDPGFRSDRVLVASLWLPPPSNPKVPAPYRTQEKRSAFVRAVLQRVRGLPGVESAAMGGGQNIPLVGWNSVSFGLEGSAQGRPYSAQATSVGPGFFTTLGLKVLSGRDFTESDDRSNRVAIVDETFARRFWNSHDVIGKRVAISSGTGPQWWVRLDSTNVQWFTIVGVVGRMKTEAFDSPDAPHIYFSIYQRSNNGMTIFLRTAGDPVALREALRREVRAADPDQPLFGIRTMDDIVSRSLARRRFVLGMIGGFAGIALLLAGLGVYGVTAVAVSHRSREIAIRVALGASRGDVGWMVVRQGLLIAGLGLLGGLAGAVVLTHGLRSMLFGATPMDPLTYLAVTGLLGVVVLLACSIPAMRAMKVEPMTALRLE